MKKEDIKLNILLFMGLLIFILSFLSFQQSKEANVNSHNAYQRAIHINDDLVESGLIKSY